MKKQNLKPKFSTFLFLLGTLSCFLMWKFRAPQAEPRKHVVARKSIAPIPKPVEQIVEPKIEEPKKDLVAQELRLSILRKIGRALEKRVVKQKRIVRLPKKVAKPLVLAEVSDDYFDIGDGDTSDFKTPLDDLAVASFEEDSLLGDFNPDMLVAALQLDEVFHSNIPPLERRNYIQEGVLQIADLSEIKNNLQEVSAESLEISNSPESTVDLSIQVEENKAEPVLITKNEPSDPSLIPQQSKAPEPELTKSEGVEARPEPILIKPEGTRVAAVQEAKPELETPPPAKKSQTIIQMAPIQGSITVPSVNTRPEVRVNPHPKTEPQQVDTQNEQESQESYVERDPGRFYGQVVIDTALNKWISQNKGHVELYLQKTKSRDPQDIQFIDFDPEENRFSFDGNSVNGPTEIYANIFSGAETVPAGQVKFPKKITAASYKEKITFYLTKKDFEKSQTTASTRTSTSASVLNITVFEAAPGNYRSTQVVKNPTVRVIGHPELKSFSGDAEGNVRILGVNSRSEYILDIEAEGYYPTRQTVSVFETTGYAAVYLVPKEKVEAITKFFTKKEQKSSKAVMLGRIFDSKTRAPKAGEEVSLSFRKGPAVYIDALPDLKLRATTSTGLFGFFNVEPSFRAVERGREKHASLHSFLPGYGVYLELGRGGARALKGKLFDPFHNENVLGQVRLVGDSDTQVQSSHTGDFKLSDIDLPPGILTVEIQAEGYPVTWQTVPWSLREPEKSRTLFMLENEMVYASSKLNHVSAEGNKGSLVGGAEPTFFSGGERCVGVSLYDFSGNELTAQKGPFPLSGAREPQKGFCLTKSAPGFVFFNLDSGEYILKWKSDKGRTLRSHVVRIGVGRVSVAVN